MVKLGIIYTRQLHILTLLWSWTSEYSYESVKLLL